MSTIAQLDDLGLALLICVVGEQHCIIRAPEHSMENVEAHIYSLASNIFSFDHASVNCESDTSGGDFMTAFERHKDSTKQSEGPRGKVCDFHPSSLALPCADASKSWGLCEGLDRILAEMYR